MDELLAWAPTGDRAWAIENANGLGCLLAQQLVAKGETLVDVPAALACRAPKLSCRSTRKTDECGGRDRYAVGSIQDGLPRPHEGPALLSRAMVHDEHGDAAGADTPALAGIRSTDAVYREVRTRPASSAEESAVFQGIRREQLLRSLIVRRGADDYVFVLVPAGKDLDWPKLRRHLGVKRLSLPPREEAEAATGYRPGTITPFGAASAWPVLVDRTATRHDVVSIGGGAPGVNIQLAPPELIRLLRADVADVASYRRKRRTGE